MNEQKDDVALPPLTYATPNRRVSDLRLSELETHVLQMFKDHEARERKWIDEVKADLMRAFPNADIDGHCDYHERKIKAAQAEEEFWKAAKIKVIENGVSGLFAILKWVAILALLGGAYKMGIGPAVAKVIGVAP